MIHFGLNFLLLVLAISSSPKNNPTRFVSGLRLTELRIYPLFNLLSRLFFFLVADEEGAANKFVINVMDLERPKELGGAVDLIKQFKLWPHHEFFCKRSLPLSITETNYVRNLVGDKEIRKGKGMELVQLFQNASGLRLGDLHICPFDLGLLGEAFRIREIAHIDLPLVEIGIPTMVSKSRAESKDKKRKCIKQEDRGKEKDKYRKLKHHCKDINGDKNGRKIIHYDSGLEHLKKPQDMV